MTETQIGFLLPSYMREIIIANGNVADFINDLANEVSGGGLVPIFSKEADKWKTPKDITNDNVLSAYNELVCGGAKFVLVFGDDASVKLFDAFKIPPANEIVGTATVITGIDVDRGEKNKHLKFWFTQEYETFILFNWLFKKRITIANKGDVPTVGLAALDAKAPLEHCNIFESLLCRQYGLYKVALFKKWEFNGKLTDEDMAQLLHTDAIFISGYADHGHKSLIEFLAKHNYNGYVFTNVALSIGEGIEGLVPHLKGLKEFPFRDKAIFYTGIGLSDVALFYRNLIKTIFGYLGYLIKANKLDWHLVRTYVSPFGVLNIADSGNMAMPLSLWKMSYDSKADKWIQNIVDVTSQSVGLTEIARFLHDINCISADFVKELDDDDGLSDVANTFHNASSHVGKLVSPDSGEDSVAAVFCSFENGAIKKLNRIDENDNDDANYLNNCLLDFMESFVKGFGHSNAALQINLSSEDFPDNTVKRLWLDCRNRHVTVPEWLVSDSCTPIGVSVTETREVIFQNRFSRIDWRQKDFEGLRTAFIAAVAKKHNYIYCVPYVADDDTGMLVVVVGRRLSSPIIQVLSTATRQLLSIYFNGRKSEALRIANSKSAIGAIMSRNGSHNIGSHVLSALSHNVGTMPDDRILYQYIQHRMDYIASATMGAPDWSVPTPFVGSVMKTFYSQRHLLDHIAESDGLHAYQYQGKGTVSGDLQENCVKIVVRRIRRYKDGEKVPDVPPEGWSRKNLPNKRCVDAYEFFHAPEQSVIWKNDEVMSIPGGILGQQAFYNVIENILRNAAKHSWAGKSAGEREAAGNLEIYVDFDTRQEEGMVCFAIGDNMSRLFAGTFWPMFFANAKLPEDHKYEDLVSVFASPLDGELVLPKTSKESSGTEISRRYAIEQFLRGKGERNSLPWFYRVLYDYVSANWESLRGDGTFRSLLSGDVSVASDDAPLGHRLPLPLHHRQEIELAKPFIDSETKRLRQASWGLSEMKISAGYLRRAEISVIGGIADEVGKHPLIVPVGIPRNEQNGKLDYKELRLAYRFWIKLPRSILIVADDISKWNLFKETNGFGVESYARIFGTHDKKGDVGLMSDYEFIVIDHDKKMISDEALKLPFRTLFVDYTGEGNKVAPYISGASLKNIDHNELVSVVYRAWLEYLKRRRGVEDSELTIKLNIYDTQGCEKGLVSDRDIYKVLFRECLHSVLEPIVDDCLKMTPTQRKALLLLSLYPLDENDKLFESVQEKFTGNHRLKIESILGRIAEKVSLFWTSLPCVHEEKECDKWKRLVCAYQAGLERATETMKYPPVIAKSLLDELSSIDRGGRDSMLLQELDTMATTPVESLIIKRAAEALDVARTTGDVFLRKYEERIVTLPRQYKGVGSDVSGKLDFTGNLGLEIFYGGNGKDAVISYNRHATDGAMLYSEPLSGSQTYLNALANLSRQDVQWAMRLAENGLLRIVIIDERVRAFVADHGEEIQKTYASMRIAVVDTQEKPKVVADSLDFKSLKYVDGTLFKSEHSNETDFDFDLVVIHQGIIDKWWKGHSKKNVKVILDHLRHSDGHGYGRFVVVTTGRGRPDNIPDNEKVLAFSSIEAFLFKRYPEKLNLVNSLMSILPGSPERNNSND